MKTAATPSFVAELPLRVGADVEALLERTFGFARNLYNATLGTVLGRYQALRESQAWQLARTLPKKEAGEEFNRLMRQADLTKSGFEKILNKHRHSSGRAEQLDCNSGQKIADRLWDAFMRYRTRQGGKPRFKSERRGIHSIEGKTNTTGFRWKAQEGCVRWGKRRLPVIVNKQDDWLMRALADPIDPSKRRRVKYCRILWRKFGGRKRWFVQLVCEGVSPIKHIFAPTERKAGIDPSTKSMTVACACGAVEKVDLATPLKKADREIRLLQRKLDRSRRATNKDNYNEDKTVKKGASGWVYSKHYEKIRTVYADAQRRAAAHRKCVCNEAVNWVLGQAGCIIVEKNNFKAFQKSRYGKSISKAAPGQFVTNLNVKAVSAGLKVFIVPPYELRPSQHDIETGQYVRHELCERWVKLGQSGLWLNRNALAALNLFWLDDAATRYSAARRSERTLGSRETGWA